MTADIEKMEKDPDAYNDADIDEIKVQIKQVEALIIELQLSIRGSTTVFESLRVQVSPVYGGHSINRHNKYPLPNCLFPVRSQPWWQPWTGWRRPMTRTWFW